MKEWLKLTSIEIARLDRNLPVLVPLGLVEAHGPHLATSVDIDSAEYFAKEVAKATGCILAPCLSYGFADEMREYPGTLGVSVKTFMSIIADLCIRFCQQGFKKVIFITGHGANKAPTELAFYDVWESYPDFKGVCWNWWSDCGISGIHHADKGETEVAMAIGTPSQMDKVMDFHVEKPWYKIRSRYELNAQSGGINGKPSEADVENGKRIKKKALAQLIQKVEQTFTINTHVIDLLHKTVLPAVTVDRVEDALKTAEALIQGGIRIMEVSFRTKSAALAVERIRKNIPEMVIGAGTLLTSKQVREASDAGAQFGLAPGINKEVIETAKSIGMPFIPGVMTPSDVEFALSLGCTIQKLFPAAQAGGITTLRALDGPYTQAGVSFVPMGGITQNNLAEFLALRNVYAVGGSWIAPSAVIAAGDFKQITENARNALSVI